ncbi:hypothetical protein ABFT23_08330 [Nocardioides sp. C4-1]|uniref:hypothetical protein n=1 Tax=Nocardioides sp. C4-1 TaxID=3151851 RepID=UPI00326590A5
MVLLWLAPTVVVTVAAMLWVSWLGRQGRGEVDREVALRRMATVLEPTPTRRRWRRRRTPGAAPAVTARRDRSTGVAVRPSRPTRPASPAGPADGARPSGDDPRPEQRRAS